VLSCEMDSSGLGKEKVLRVLMNTVMNLQVV
jgi:hypothetical protein